MPASAPPPSPPPPSCTPLPVGVVDFEYDAPGAGDPATLPDPADHLVGSIFYPAAAPQGPEAGGSGWWGRSAAAGAPAPRWVDSFAATHAYLRFASRGAAGGRLAAARTAAVAAAAHGLVRTVRLPVAGYGVPAAGVAAGGAPFPSALFSHGIGGTRSTYSVLCAELAAQGFVVLAIEHADGTASRARLAGARAPMQYQPWRGRPGTAARAARRAAELTTAARVLAAVGEGESGLASLAGLALCRAHGGLLAGAVAPGPPAVVGHSFGGASAAAAAADGGAPVAVAVDPWWGALPDGCAAETAGRAPLLVVGSEAWNTAPPSGGNLPCGGAAQERVLAAAAVGAGALHVVPAGTRHGDFSDVSALVAAKFPFAARRAASVQAVLEGGAVAGPATPAAAAVFAARLAAAFVRAHAGGGGVGRADADVAAALAAEAGVGLASVRVVEGSARVGRL